MAIRIMATNKTATATRTGEPMPTTSRIVIRMDALTTIIKQAQPATTPVAITSRRQRYTTGKGEATAIAGTLDSGG